MRKTYIISIAFFLLISCADYDVVIRNGMVYDGTGEEPYTGDVAIINDKIVKVSKSINGKGKKEINASGLASRGKRL